MSAVAVREDGAIATLTIEREDKLNALSGAVLGELTRAAAELDARPGERRPRVVILTGAGRRAFAAGADIEELSTLGVTGARAYSELARKLGRALEEASFPVLAAVNGFALGGGLELALCCDLILAAEGARLGQPEVNLGLIPGFGGTVRLAERVGVARARRLLYTGELLNAEQALSAGLVDAVFPDDGLVAGTRELAERIASKAPLAIAATKRSLLRTFRPHGELGIDHESQTFAGLFSTEDAAEGIGAFLAKRAASFNGR